MSAVIQSCVLDYAPLGVHEALTARDCSEDGDFIVSWIRVNGKIYYLNVVENEVLNGGR